MRKKPFKNCSKFMTGGNFKNNMADMFSFVDIKEEPEKETAQQKSSNTLKELEESYKKILGRKKLVGTARKITFTDHPDLIFISFKATRMQANWEASKYFHDSYHPYFIGMDTQEIVRTARGIRVPELDEYSKTGKVPIYKLMQKLNATFSCSICGKHHFTYEDYCKNLCFIVEGEWNSLPFIEGYLLCYKCHEKLMG